MRLVSFVAPTSQQAMAALRTKLGDDAVIVTTQSLESGEVRVTGAVAETDLDLVDVLSPAGKRQDLEWLTGLHGFHEWPETLGARVSSLCADMAEGDPKSILTSAMRSIFRFEDLTSRQGKPLLLSGPPGSGKTATIAKLAALQVLADRSVEVFTTDAERAGGLEQLSALLDPLGLRPRVISTPGEARSVMAASTSSLVLIDGPGTNPYSSADLGSLSTLIDRLDAELLLVMEAGRSPADSAEIGECYAALGASRMIVTKLDVTRRLGGLLAVAEAGLAFSGAGIGPTIGDGFRPLTADGLARLLLGRFDRRLIEEGRS